MAISFRGRCLRVVLLVGLAMSASVPAVTAQTDAKRDLYGDPLPEGAVARMGSMRFRQHALSMVCAPDGKLLIANTGTAVRLLDPLSGKKVREITVDSRREVHASVDGKLLATASYRGIHLLDPSAGRLLRTITGRYEVLAFSPDGGLLATVSETDKNVGVSLWDPATGKLIRVLSDKDGKPYRHDDVEVGGFAPDGTTFVSASERDTILRHWDVKTGKLTARVETVWSSWNPRAMSPDARSLLVVSKEGDVSMCDTMTGTERFRLNDERSACFSFTLDGKTLFGRALDEEKGETIVTFWDVQTGKERRKVTIPTFAWQVALTPDERTLLVSRGYGCSLWEATTGKRIAGCEGHDQVIESLAFTHDGRRLVSGSQDGTLRLWDVATGKQERVLTRTGNGWGYSTVAISHDDRSVLSACENDLVLLDLASGKELRRFKPSGGTFHPDMLVMTPDGRSAVSRSFSRPDASDYCSRLLVWDLAMGKVTAQRDERSEGELGMTSAISPDGRWSIRKSQIGHGYIQEGGSDRLLLKLPFPNTQDCPPAISPDGRLMVSLSYAESPDENWRSRKSTLYGWELATGKECFRIPIPNGDSWITAFQIIISPDGRTVAATRENTLQVWDAVSGKELLHRTDPESRPWRLAFAPDGKRLATGHVDGSILVWDLSEQLAKRPAPPIADAKSVDQWWAAFDGEDARAAYAAVFALAAAPSRTLPLLRDKLKPVAVPSADRIRRLIDELDDEDFTRRTAAAKELASLDELAEPALRKALAETPSPEQRRQLKSLLESLPTGLLASRTALRPLRALHVLERIGTPEAREIVEALAKGAPGARLTRETAATLERLDRRARPER